MQDASSRLSEEFLARTSEYFQEWNGLCVVSREEGSVQVNLCICSNVDLFI